MNEKKKALFSAALDDQWADIGPTHWLVGEEVPADSKIERQCLGLLTKNATQNNKSALENSPVHRTGSSKCSFSTGASRL